MFMNGTTALGNEDSEGENETQIRKEYKAAKGDKVVKKQGEDWSTGIHRQQGSECPACCRLSSQPKQSWRWTSCMGEPWLLERLHCVHCENSRRRLQYTLRAESIGAVCIVQVTGISGLLSGMSTC